MVWEISFGRKQHPQHSGQVIVKNDFQCRYLNKINLGKTISFLKNRCRCNYSIPIPFIDHEKILCQDIYESSNILSVEFKRWLTTVYENLSSTLVNEMKHQYNLASHLNSMKCFYLMGKGDFVQHLVDTLVANGELERPKHQVYELNLDSYIAEAINKCFQDYEMDQYKGKS